MPIQSSGKLLIQSQPSSGGHLPGALRFDAVAPIALLGYRLEPLFVSATGEPRLFKGTMSRAAHAAALEADVPPQAAWHVATPQRAVDEHPWDVAHEAAAETNYTSYIEPDLLNEPTIPEAIATAGTNSNWPPPTPVSPGWHLLPGFTDFVTARQQADGTGIRIAHLDTGYWPEHVSTPRHMHPELGYNFSEGNHNTTDPGTGGWLNNPGHGTSTLAILAGNAVDLMYQGMQFSGDFGAAPEADVIPVRIGPSVVHFYTEAMAKGIHYALGPSGDPNNPSPANRCDVISISHGGLPARSWADAVNAAYEAGIVIVAASGDNFYTFIRFPTRFTVYPSAFNRVVTAVGATYDRTPYVTQKFGEMEGNWGPPPVMQKAIAAFTPNIAGMKFRTKQDFDMSFGGTSASTPQIAAACALWLQLYGSQFALGPQRVEACRLALFASTAMDSVDQYLGRGVLNASTMLAPATAAKIVALGDLPTSPPDEVSLPVARILLGDAPPNSEQERMYETELAQILHRSQNAELVARYETVVTGAAPDTDRMRALLRDEPTISNALRSALAA